ncbi:MAG: hypothetical protein ABFR82_16885 [Nitrospirota bacterium]
MKNLVIAIAVVSVLALGTLAFAHGTGGWGGGYMMGPGYGGHMTGPGYGGHMMGRGAPTIGIDRRFLDETTDLRKEIHEKRFEYFEARRNPGTTTETLTTLEREIGELQEKLYAKAPRSAKGGFGGYGNCF